MGFSDSKAYKKTCFMRVICGGGKIHMLFYNEFSICTIFTGDQCRRFHTPGAGGPGVQLPEAHWF